MNVCYIGIVDYILVFVSDILLLIVCIVIEEVLVVIIVEFGVMLVG